MGYFDKTVEFILKTPVEELEKKMREYGVNFIENKEDLIFLYKEYADEANCNLTNDAIDLKNKLNKIREFYNNLTDEEFKQRLIDAGFELIERPPCYSPNDGVYPLCIGNNSEICNVCCLYENMIERFGEEYE